MAFENFTTYTEVDPTTPPSWGTLWVASSTIVNGVNVDGATAYLYKDAILYGGFGTFTHYFTVQPVAKTVSVNNNTGCAVWGLANYVGPLSWYDSGNSNFLKTPWVVLGYSNYPDQPLTFGWYLQLVKVGGGFSGVRTAAGVIQEGVIYYCKITRTGSTYTLYIYSDSGRTNLLDSLTIGAAQGLDNSTFRYLYPVNNMTDEKWWSYITFNVSALDVTVPTGGTVNATTLTTTASTIAVGKKIIPRSCPPIEISTFYKYSMTVGNGFTFPTNNSIVFTNTPGGSRKFAYTYHTSVVGTWQGHFTRPTWGGGAGTVWIYAAKWTQNDGSDWVGIYYGRQNGIDYIGLQNAPSSNWSYTFTSTDIYYTVTVSPTLVWTITLYSDAARTVVVGTRSFTKTTQYRYLVHYDDNGAAAGVTYSGTIDQLNSVGEYPLTIQSQTYWTQNYRYTPTIKLRTNATTLSRPALTYAPLVRKMETPFATATTIAPRPQLSKTVSGLVASPSLLFGMAAFLPLYTKNDATQNLTVTNQGVSGVATRTTTSQLWRDAGVGAIQNFTLTFKARAVGNPINGAIAPLMFGITTSNAVLQSGGLNAIRPSIFGANSKWYIHLVAPNVGAAVSQEISKDTDYYTRVVRAGSVLTLEVYSDAAMTTQVGTTQTTTCQPSLAFRYFFPFNSYTDNAANVNFNFAFDEVQVYLPPRIDLKSDPSTVSAVSSLIAPTYATGGSVSPSLFQLTASVIAPRIFASIRVEPDVVECAGSVIAPTPRFNRYQGTLLAPSILYQPEFGGSVEFNAPLLTATVVQYAPTLTTGSDVQPPVFDVPTQLFTSGIEFRLNETCLSRPCIVYPPNYVQKQRVRPNCLFLTSGLLSPRLVFTLNRTCFEATSYTPLNHRMGFTVNVGLESVGSIISPSPVFDISLGSVSSVASVIAPSIQITQHGTILPQVLNTPCVLYGVQVNLRPVMTEVNTVSGVVSPAIQVSKGVGLVSCVASVLSPKPAIVKTVGLVSAQAGLIAPVMVSGGDVSVSTLNVVSSLITPQIIITLNPNVLNTNAHVDIPSENRVINVPTLSIASSVFVPTIYNGWVISLGDALNVVSGVVSPTVAIDRGVGLLSGSCAMPQLDIEFTLNPLNLTCPTLQFIPAIRAGGRTVFPDTFTIVVSQPDEGILVEKTLSPITAHARFEGIQWESEIGSGMSKIIGRSADASKVMPNLAEWQLALAKRILSEGVWAVHLLMPELDMEHLVRVLFVPEFAATLLAQLEAHEFYGSTV